MIAAIGTWLKGLAPRIATLASITLACAALADLTWLWLTPPSAIVLAPLEDGGGSGQGGAERPRYGIEIAARHLFGQPPKAEAPPPPQETVTTAPKTNLNLVLKGVLATGDKQALAIIATAGGRDERLYGIGDALPGGVTLAEVHPDRVILGRSGRFEALPFPEVTRKGRAATTELTPPPPPKAKESPPATVGATERLAQHRRELMRNPSQLAAMLNPRPVRDGDRFVGYRIEPRGDAALARDLGLQAGDIVTAINGVLLDKPEKGLVAARSLLNAREITLEVLRNGSPIALTQTVGP